MITPGWHSKNQNPNQNTNLTQLNSKAAQLLAAKHYASTMQIYAFIYSYNRRCQIGRKLEAGTPNAVMAQTGTEKKKFTVTVSINVIRVYAKKV
jgi:hypothetical protein